MVWIIIGIVAALAILTLIGAFICFRMAFYSSPKRPEVHRQEYPVPSGRAYEVFKPQIIEWVKQARAFPYKEVSITSFDGLTLRGRYYEFSPDAPIELLVHGYRGWGERDLSGGIDRCRRLNHNALVIDHRGSNTSDGTVITFGILESRDCAQWVDFILKEIDPQAKIILTGISMGASTVMIMASRPLPPNVVGVLADCGFTSAEEIIKKVLCDMKLPPKPLYPIVRLGARIFGNFDLDETSSIESMKSCRLPIIFFHGDCDGYVPHYMSVKNYEACASEQKKLVSIAGAEHGLCFPVDEETYLKEMQAFFEPILNENASV